jgi:queuine tRNA-ribosyltransferase
VTFKSAYDGSAHRLTPERAVQLQVAIGADIQMVLDECPALPAPIGAVRTAVERTAAWAARARAEYDRLAGDGAPSGQALFGIVQGGVDRALRHESALRTVDIGFDGYAIGGLSVGEAHAEMVDALGTALEDLPADAPRYLMGVGDPAGLVEAIAMGVDMFDCVLPTRLARHGTALTSAGRMSMSAAAVALDEAPVDPSCGCSTCARHSRGYLRHLFQVGEPTAARLLTVHNLTWTLELMRRSRAAVAAGTLGSLRAEIAAAWGHPPQVPD